MAALASSESLRQAQGRVFDCVWGGEVPRQTTLRMTALFRFGGQRDFGRLDSSGESAQLDAAGN